MNLELIMFRDIVVNITVCFYYQDRGGFNNGKFKGKMIKVFGYFCFFIFVEEMSKLINEFNLLQFSLVLILW